MWLTLLLLATPLVALALYRYLQHIYTYWQRRGFPYDTEAKMPYGSLIAVRKREKGMGLAIYEIYKRSQEKFLGLYLIFRPGLLVRDVKLVRHVLAQDFAHFHDRGIYVDEENDPLSGNLFALRGLSWRTMRAKLAPSFSSGKLKGMMGTVEDIGNKMTQYLNATLPETGSQEVNLKEVTTTYAIDIIGSVIFGLDINSFDQPDNKFRGIVKQARRESLFSAVFSVLIFLWPSFAKVLFKLGFKNQIGIMMLDIMRDTIQYREKHNIVRKDLLQLLMQLRNTGSITEDDSNWQAQHSIGQMKSLSMETITAQALIFYIAGQETTASTASFTIFELAQYPELLKRAQQEVDEVLRKNDGKLDYEVLKQMEFLDLCIQETLRKYPGLPMLNRECTKDYRIPDTDLIVEKGTPVVISLYGLHHDPEHFPHPEEYDPERFLASRMDYNPEAYMPFGEGPRHCIAQRMGKVDAKLAVVKILQHFEVETTERRELEFDTHSLALVPRYGVKVRLSKRHHN